MHKVKYIGLRRKPIILKYGYQIVFNFFQKKKKEMNFKDTCCAQFFFCNPLFVHFPESLVLWREITMFARADTYVTNQSS